MRNTLWVGFLTLLIVPSAFCGDWNKKLAAEYLDSRQQEWFAWKSANAGGHTCVSCHTSMTYLLARPALRKSLGEGEATRYEKGLLDSLRGRVDKMTVKEAFPNGKEPHASEFFDVEAIFAAWFLAQEDRGRDALSPATKQAFDRIWSLQLRDGKAAGSWTWNEFDLSPWEIPDSQFYGAALAALATGITPASYREQPDVKQRVAALTAYLQREQAKQSLHNRLMLLWAATEAKGLLPDAARKDLIAEVQKKQEADGGWALESLGPWPKHPHAPAAVGSNSYATAFTAFVLQKAGVKRTNPTLTRSLVRRVAGGVDEQGLLRSHAGAFHARRGDGICDLGVAAVS